MILNLLFLLIGGLCLWKGADWLVDSASAIARKLGISELVIGLTIVAMGTSLPEFLVTFTAAVKGLTAISLANVVGSNIFNLGIILGVMAILSPVASDRALIRRDAPILLGTVSLIWYLASDGELSHLDGALLCAIFFAYLFWIMLRSRNSLGDIYASDDEPHATWKDYLLLPLGIIAVSAGSQLMVEGAAGFARALGVSEWLIGLTIVAAGTSLPELVTCLAASLKGRNDMLLGNLIGSDFFNFAGVLGLTSLVRSLDVDTTTLPSVGLAAGSIALVLLFMATGGKVGKREGFLLILIGLVRWGSEVM